MDNDIQDVDYNEVGESRSTKINSNNIRGKAIYFSTSQVAKMLDTSDSKIRYYTSCFDEVLKIEISNKQRRYTQADIDKLAFLIDLKNSGMTIKQIQEYSQEVSFEEGIQVKESNPLSLQAIAKALMEEHYNQLQELKNDIREIVEVTVENKLNLMMESNNVLMDNAREQIALTVDGIVSEKLDQVGVLITEQNNITNSKIDQIEATATARDTDLISKLQNSLDKHKQEYEESKSKEEKKKGLFSRLFHK